MNPKVLWIVLLVALAFAVGMVVERLGSGAAQAAAAEASLTEELRGIRSLLEKIAKQAEGGGGLGQIPEPLLQAPARLVEGLLDQASGGSALQAKDPAVDKALRELYDQVKEEGRATREALDARGVVAFAELRAAKPAPDHAALSQFAALHAQSPNTLLLARVDEVLARFGIPDSVHAPAQGGFDVFYRHPQTGDSWIELQIVDGYVVRAHVQ